MCIESIFVLRCSEADREVKKLQMECKKMAKQNQLPAAKTLAKQVIQGRKMITRLHTTKANINSVQLSMKQQMGDQTTSAVFAAFVNNSKSFINGL